jgi:hypothetical protein
MSEDICLHRCKCPACETLLFIEEVTLAHYCRTCKQYKLPEHDCPNWEMK